MKLQPRSEKGLLTPDNCVITLIDHQPQMLFGVTSIDRQSLINNVVGFAKAATNLRRSFDPEYGRNKGFQWESVAPTSSNLSLIRRRLSAAA